MPNPDVAYEHAGSASPAELNGAINDTVLTIVCDDLSGWPTGTDDFWVTIDPGTADEERILCASRTGDTLTVTASGRGADDTVARSHLDGAVIVHGFSAAEANQLSSHVSATSGVHGRTGDLVGTSDAQTMTNKTLTAPTITAPTIGAAQWTNAGHTHVAASTGGALNHALLTGLTTGDPHTQYQKESEKAVASGYAGLDADGLVPTTQLPTLAAHLIADLDGDTLPKTINASIKTIAITTDVATEDDITYMVVGKWPYFDPDTADGFQIQFSLEESYDSGGAWVSVSSDVSSDYLLVGNGGQGGQVGGNQIICFATPGVQATCRWRLRAVRAGGTNTGDINDASIHVVRIGEKLF